jgi:hypothetical protein
MNDFLQKMKCFSRFVSENLYHVLDILRTYLNLLTSYVHFLEVKIQNPPLRSKNHKILHYGILPFPLILFLRRRNLTHAYIGKRRLHLLMQKTLQAFRDRSDAAQVFHFVN